MVRNVTTDLSQATVGGRVRADNLATTCNRAVDMVLRTREVLRTCCGLCTCKTMLSGMFTAAHARARTNMTTRLTGILIIWANSTNSPSVICCGYVEAHGKELSSAREQT